jgi:hypothetical protein
VFEHCSLGILPIVSLARLMPERIQICSTIDFPEGGKILPVLFSRGKKKPGKNCRGGQDLPGGPANYSTLTQMPGKNRRLVRWDGRRFRAALSLLLGYLNSDRMDCGA